jgi:hypothetical protein
VDILIGCHGKADVDALKWHITDLFRALAARANLER